MKSLPIFVTLTCAFFGAMAAAEEAPKLEVATSLVELLITNDPGEGAMQEGFWKPVEMVIETGLKSGKFTDNDARLFRKAATESAKLFTRQRLVSELARTYAESFSAEELESILAFHRSPAGRKFRERQPELKAEREQLTRRIANEISADTSKRFEALRKAGDE